ncbi:MAG: hypothetical protein JXC35_05000 [Acholeplasmataceae bacterium]|nr:hypothetical protein [Acholeplasmataceae bacterium]
MRKYSLIIMSILIIVLSVVGVSYAWFTYLETKSLASFTAGEIDLELRANHEIVIDNYDLSNLAYIDYEDDLISNISGSFDDMASILRLDFIASDNTVAIKNQFELIENTSTQGLIYLILFEGLNMTLEDPIQSNYYDIIHGIIQSELTKEGQLQAIRDYNQATIDYLESIILTSGQTMTIQIVFYGDYDDLPVGEDYLNQSFPFTLVINTINEKGVVLP